MKYYSYPHHFTCSRYLRLHANWIKKNPMPPIVSLMINMPLRKLTILSYLKTKQTKAITSSIPIVLIYILKAGCETYWRWGSLV